MVMFDFNEEHWWNNVWIELFACNAISSWHETKYGSVPKLVITIITAEKVEIKSIGNKTNSIERVLPGLNVVGFTCFIIKFLEVVNASVMVKFFVFWIFLILKLQLLIVKKLTDEKKSDFGENWATFEKLKTDLVKGR